MKSSTSIWGYNVIIVPIDSDDHLCPIRFSTLLKEWNLKEYYFDWEIIEYNEMMWSFHRKDENWNKIISRFATIIAKKI
jgi:tellurite methyltransferase